MAAPGHSTAADKPDSTPETSPSAQALSSHTPGPWHVCGHYVRSEGDAYICDIKFPVEDDSEIAANARLLAAAPDLLDRLKKLGLATRDGYCFCDPEKPITHSHPEWCRNAAAAIAKAEGR